MPAEDRFPVMGTEAHVVVVGGDEPAALRRARLRLDELERRWSRFRPGSEISRLNIRAGRPVVVSPDTYQLVARAVGAWQATGGRFDPTVLPEVAAAGYDRDFALLAAPGREGPVPGRARVPAPSPGCAGVRFDLAVTAVWLPPGVAFDPGGIGKGLAADLVSADLLRLGAEGALVNLGGDLRVRGRPPEGRAWVVTVEDPADPGRELARFALESGAVATSSRLRRRWVAGGAEQHHLIDPTTGAPAGTETVSATVVAAEGWWAEALATAMCVSPAPAALPARPDASVLVVREDGSTVATPELEGALV